MTQSSLLTLPNWAYSDASMQPYGTWAVLAAVLEGQTIVQKATVSSTSEAELLAAELAVAHAPAQQPLHLYTDSTFVVDALSGQYDLHEVFHRLGECIQILADWRGIKLSISHVPAAQNLAHAPAITHYRQLECRPKHVYQFYAKGPLVRVRGPELDFHGIYEAPAGFYALCELAERLPAGVIAQAKGLMPMAWTYWHNPKKGDTKARKQAKQALKILGQKNSDIHLWQGNRPSF